MIKISIPATSSILGVGSSCLGMALQERFEILVHQDKNKQVLSENHIIYEAYKKTLNYIGVDYKDIYFEIVQAFTSADVYGCRSAYILAGCMAANMVAKNKINKYEILNIACTIDPFFTHIAPALFGGLCVTFMYEDKPVMIRYGVKRDWVFLCIVPDYVEAKSKKVKKTKVQEGQYCAIAKGIEIGNALIVKKAIGTVESSKIYDDVITMCKEQNAICTISEDEKGCFVMIQDLEVASAMKEELQKRYPSWSISLQTSTYDGAYTEEV